MPIHTTKNRPASVSNKQKMLMQSLTHFFTASRPTSCTPKHHHASGGKLRHEQHMQQFLEQVQKGAPISLRVIDWFVTNYSRENDITYTHKYTGKPFNVHESYKSQLKAYSKRQFDPFCRRNRINFYYKEDGKVVTTVGQLNFFRWAIENHVIDYVREHLADIELSMRQFVRLQREEKRKLNTIAGGGSHSSTSAIAKTRRRNKHNNSYGKVVGKPPQHANGELAIPKGNIYTHRANITVDFS